MDIKFGKDSEEQPQQPVTEKKGQQSVVLVVLLLLICGFGYVYFFTDVIKPQQEQKAAEAPAPQVVKKPLPPSDGQPAKAETAAAPAAVQAAAPATAPAPVAAAAKPEPVKPAVEPKKAEAAKPAIEPKKVDAAKPAAKPSVPAVAKADEKKAAPVDKKPAAAPEKKVPAATAAVAKTAAAKPVEKKAAAEPAVKKSAPKPEQKTVAASKEAGGTSDSWTLLVGNYLLEEALVTDLVRVRKAGLEASIVPGGQKKTKMNRLLLGEFEDREAAQVQLEKLKRYTSDAFIIDSAGKHVVYAGSYLLDARAGSERERLSAAGFNLTIKRTDVSIGSKNLTTGVFADKKTADETLKKLKAAGINATVVRR